MMVTKTRLLRVTHWPDPYSQPVTMATLETDLNCAAEEAIEQMLLADRDIGFMTYEIVESEHTELVEAVTETILRAQQKEIPERDMAIAYYYYVGVLRTLTPDGTLAGTRSTPLTRQQMAWVFRSVAQCRLYQAQHLIVPLTDGTVIEMLNGQVLPA